MSGLLTHWVNKKLAKKSYEIFIKKVIPAWTRDYGRISDKEFKKFCTLPKSGKKELPQMLKNQAI